MKALTIHEPYAARIACGKKTREFRGWRTRHRGPLLVCSARPPLGTGLAVCVVELVEVEERKGGGFAWVLSSPVPLAAPFPVSGKPGLFSVDVPAHEVPQIPAPPAASSAR